MRYWPQAVQLTDLPASSGVATNCWPQLQRTSICGAIVCARPGLGTVNGRVHIGHFTTFPASPSRAMNRCAQCWHVTAICFAPGIGTAVAQRGHLTVLPAISRFAIIRWPHWHMTSILSEGATDSVSDFFCCEAVAEESSCGLALIKSASSEAKSFIERYRWSISFAIALVHISASRGLMSGRYVVGDGASLEMICPMIDATEPVNGRFPVSSSYRITPKL